MRPPLGMKKEPVYMRPSLQDDLNDDDEDEDEDDDEEALQSKMQKDSRAVIRSMSIPPKEPEEEMIITCKVVRKN